MKRSELTGAVGATLTTCGGIPETGTAPLGGRFLLVTDAQEKDWWQQTHLVTRVTASPWRCHAQVGPGPTRLSSGAAASLGPVAASAGGGATWFFSDGSSPVCRSV